MEAAAAAAISRSHERKAKHETLTKGKPFGEIF